MRAKVLLKEVCPSISETNIALTLLEHHKQAKIVEADGSQPRRALGRAPCAAR